MRRRQGNIGNIESEVGEEAQKQKNRRRKCGPAHTRYALRAQPTARMVAARRVAIGVALAVCLLASLRLLKPRATIKRTTSYAANIDTDAARADTTRSALRRAIEAAAAGSPDSVQSAMTDAVRLFWNSLPSEPQQSLSTEQEREEEGEEEEDAEDDEDEEPPLPPNPPLPPRPPPSPSPPPPPAAERALSSVLLPPPSPPAASTSNAAITPSMARILGSSAPLLKLHSQSQKLKLYVYEPKPTEAGWCDSNLTKRFPNCKGFQWSGDYELLERVRSSPLRTMDGDSADFYLVPFLSKCYFNYAASYELKPMDSVLQQVLSFLRRTPWWKQRPDRHLFFFMSGVGAGIVPSWHKYLKESVFVVAEGDRQADYFREGHDIVVPGKVSTKHKESSKQKKTGSRKLIGVFRGSSPTRRCAGPTAGVCVTRTSYAICSSTRSARRGASSSSRAGSPKSMCRRWTTRSSASYRGETRRGRGGSSTRS